MVILSDVVQYDPGGGVPYEELLERVSGSGVMLYSVGLGNDQASLDSMGRLAEFGDAFFVTGFDLAGCSAPVGETAVSVTMAAGSELVGRAEMVVDLPELEGVSGEVPAPSQTLPPSFESQSGAASGRAALLPAARHPLSPPKRTVRHGCSRLLPLRRCWLCWPWLC